MKKVLVIGGGIFGTMHAFFALKNGYEVVQCDKDLIAQSASIRNFGLIWVSGREAGPELELAIRSRELWEEIGAQVGNIGYRSNGSLTVAVTKAEWQIVNEAANMMDAGLRGFTSLTKSQVLELEPNLNGNYFGALQCSLDAAIEPNLLFSGLRSKLLENPNYKWINNFEVLELVEEVNGVTAISSDGLEITADEIYICIGAYHKGFLAPFLENAPIRRVRLQMGATEPLNFKINHSLADGDSFRYYPAFKDLSLSKLSEQSPIAKEKAMQLLAVQRFDGSFTIGDTHEYQEPFEHEIFEAPYEHLQNVLANILGRPAPRIQRRWEGIYSQITSYDIYFREEIFPGVHVVTAGGGRGNTLAPAIAEESFK